MQEKVSLKNNESFRFYKKYLGFAGFFHFLVDFLPISVLYFFYKNDTDFGVLIVIYNLLAFATQPFLGFIVDKLENKNFTKDLIVAEAKEKEEAEKAQMIEIAEMISNSGKSLEEIKSFLMG